MIYKQIFANFTDSDLIILGFVLFMVTFLGALVWILFVQKKSFYDERAQQPLISGEDYGK